MIAATQSSSPFADSAPSAEQVREGVIQRLRAFGLRVTAPRIALLETLSNAGQPVTIEQLSSKIGDNTCDLVTIYRTMAALERAGVVYRCGFSARGAALFNVMTEAGRRYTLIRKGSAVAEELDDESSRELRATIDRIRNRLRERGYGELEHIVEFIAT